MDFSTMLGENHFYWLCPPPRSFQSFQSFQLVGGVVKRVKRGMAQGGNLGMAFCKACAEAALFVYFVTQIGDEHAIWPSRCITRT
jgi:hypothetical protein